MTPLLLWTSTSASKLKFDEIGRWGIPTKEYLTAKPATSWQDLDEVLKVIPLLFFHINQRVKPKIWAKEEELGVIYKRISNLALQIHYIIVPKQCWSQTSGRMLPYRYTRHAVCYMQIRWCNCKQLNKI